ncbi:TolC family protein [Marinobacterium iners]|uniref:Outer membrane protein TolC n=1 Tax=Marinobacterium iners DSM 11526 TaxID=1122198 RepID=A0A1H4BV13_9GAMM|nr:TolC family protein [Marinobacterium iners]SEA51934.1 Outer membrane protein TolC [Marinobacterium iners DSM 11526]
MFKKTLLATSLALAITGCSVTPNSISTEQLATTAQSDLELLTQDVAVESAISLDEAIARAVVNNRDRKLKALEAALAQGQIDLVSHEMLPSLTASAGYSKRDEYAASQSATLDPVTGELTPASGSYSVSQDKERGTYDVAFAWNVLDFGLSYVRAGQHADRYLISKERERKVLHNITQDVRAAYWRAVSAERLLGKINPLINEASGALRDSQKVESQRLLPPLEALYYQRELLDVLRALQSLRQDLMGAKTELAGLMGLKPGTQFDLADVQAPDFTVPQLSMPVDKMEELALQQRPELIETHYQKRISAAEARAAIIDMLPGINLTAGVYNDSSDYVLHQDWTSFGAQISWNLFDVFKVGAERRMAKTREALAEEQRLAASMAVLTQVHLARIRYQEAMKSFDLAGDYLSVAERIGDQTRNAAQLKRTSKLDLIRESLNTLLAELRRDVAYADLQNSYGRMYVSMGMDLLPEDYATYSLESLSQQIGERFSAWQSEQPETGAQVSAETKSDTSEDKVI